MSNIADFASLKLAVQKWMEKEGEPALLDQLDTIVQMAESWLSRKLRGYQREVTGTITVDADGKGSIPAGTLSIKSVTQNGVPRAFSLSGQSVTVLRAPSATLDMVSVVRVPSLSTGNPTNWLIEEAPDAYLYACLAQASIFKEAFENAAIYHSQAQSVLDDVSLTSIGAQYGMASLTPEVQIP